MEVLDQSCQLAVVEEVGGQVGPAAASAVLGSGVTGCRVPGVLSFSPPGGLVLAVTASGAGSGGEVVDVPVTGQGCGDPAGRVVDVVDGDGVEHLVDAAWGVSRLASRAAVVGVMPA